MVSIRTGNVLAAVAKYVVWVVAAALMATLVIATAGGVYLLTVGGL